MADTIIKYISLNNLNVYHDLEKSYIDQNIAKTLKTVALSPDGKKLLFYTQEKPVDSYIPAFEIEIPETDLSGVIAKVVSAISGNVPIFEAGGGLKDSGVSLDDLATKTYVTTEIAKGVENATHLSKEIVTSLPDVSQAKENTIYLIKKENAQGSDKYEEWILIGGELVCIGDTTIDLSDYSTTDQINDKIAAAKQEAIDAAASDAQTKANAALESAKQYTDIEIGKINSKVNKNTEDISKMSGDIVTINNTLNVHEDRIKALENGIPDLATASTQDIYDLFGLTAPVG